MSHCRCKGLKLPENSCILGIESDRTTMVKVWASSWAGAFHSKFGHFSYTCQVDLERAADLRGCGRFQLVDLQKPAPVKETGRYLWLNVWRHTVDMNELYWNYHMNIIWISFLSGGFTWIDVYRPDPGSWSSWESIIALGGIEIATSEEVSSPTTSLVPSTLQRYLFKNSMHRQSTHPNANMLSIKSLQFCHVLS